MARPAGRHPFGERVFLLAVAAMLLAPLLAHLLGGPAAQTDNRRLAPAPAVPRTAEALVDWPRQTEAYLDDHFGLRRRLVDLATGLRWDVLRSSPVAAVVRGRNGRIFLSEGDVPLREVLSDCGAWWAEPQVAQYARELEQGLARLQDLLPGASVLVVPTSPVLYPQDLPGWIARACAGRVPLAEDLLRRLPGELRGRIAYPRDIAATLPPAAPLVPPHNFHWIGAGVHAFLGRFAERDLHLTRLATPAWTEKVEEADLALYVPGVGLSNRVRLADWAGAGVRRCAEAACTDRPPLDGIALPSEAMRLERPGAGGRLLLIGDSFLAGAADALIGYASDIITLNLNNLPRLSREEQRLLWERVTVAWQPDRVLMVVNDGNVTAIARYAEAIAAATSR